MLKIVLTVIGLVAVAIGLAWVLEGLSILPPIIPPARLEGHITLTGNGAFLTAVAAMLIVWANRARSPRA